MKECAQDSKEPASLPCPQLQLLVLHPWCSLPSALTELSLFPKLLLLHYLKYLAMWPVGSHTILLEESLWRINPLSHKLHCIVMFNGKAKSKCFILTAKSYPLRSCRPCIPWKKILGLLRHHKQWKCENKKYIHIYILDIMAFTEPEFGTS